MVTLTADRLDVTLGARRVLADVTLDLRPGALVGVIGPNGAGKSTLVRALLGLVAPSHGRVLLDGADIAALPRAAVAHALAYLPQGQTLHWPLSVERVVALGRLPHLAPFSSLAEADRTAIDQAMARADITHLATRTATELSGGERARVLLARALAQDAPALLVDEPLAALDPAHQLDIAALLRAEADAGRLVVAVLHDLGLAARICDRLLLLDAGGLVADGTPADVLTRDRLAHVFGIRAWSGTTDGLPLLVPIERC